MKKVILIILSIAILIGFYFIFIKGEDKTKELIGELEYKVYDEVIETYTFGKDHAGIYNLSGKLFDFLYYIEDEKLLFLFDNDAEPVSLKYKVEENKLTIYNVYDEEMVYNKKI